MDYKCVLCGSNADKRIITYSDDDFKSVRKKHNATKVPMSAFVCKKCVEESKK